MLKAFLPQPVVVADGAELLDGEISQHSYAAEFVRNFSGFLLLTFTWHTRRFERLRSELRFENCGLSCGSRVGLCETIGTTTKPLKVGDSVTIRGSPVICLVTGVDTEKNTADVKATREVIVLHKDVP